MKKILFIILLASIIIQGSFAQVLDPVKWKFSAKKIDDKTFVLMFNATIEDGWHMYGLNIEPGGPIPTSINYNDSSIIKFLSDIQLSEKPELQFDPTFEMNVELFDHAISFSQKIQLVNPITTSFSGYVEFMACDDSRCLPPKEVEFSFTLFNKNNAEKSKTLKELHDDKDLTENPETPGGFEKADDIRITTEEEITAEETTQIVSTDISDANENDDQKSLLTLFFVAFLAGFGALVTPCVYPIIPLTVSFFMRDSSRSKAIYNGVIFGLSIIFIYTLVGLIAGLFQVDLVGLVRTHWLPNLIFLLVFIILAISFFGVFEITLPSSLSTKIDKQADKGGLLGPFFMALATVVISFSCTGIIVGVALGSAMQGDIIKPVVGMFGFSVSFALPFTLLAIFPSLIKSMPKSGGWLNSVKVVIAFILLISSLMFAGNLGLSRDMVLSFAIVLLILLGFYLLGKISFSHDSPLEKVSVTRVLLAVLSFSMAVYLIPGLFGAPLKSISPFLPAKNTNSIDLTKITVVSQNSIPLETISMDICDDTPKYSDLLELPLGLKGYFDYNEALECAKKLNKPVLLDFAGHTCKNCKKMYAEVWSDPLVLHKLKTDFIVTALYTDDRTKLPETDWVVSAIDGRVKNTIGKKFNDLQISKFGTNALPLYAIVDAEGNVLTSDKYYTYSSDVEKFLSFLENGIHNFNARNFE